jgi:hypothetical protein
MSFAFILVGIHIAVKPGRAGIPREYFSQKQENFS